MRIAGTTLGCKVNQYDTEAMLERFEESGWEIVDFSGEAEAYLVNTCTVTGTGDQKSVKLIRRVAREHPNAAILAAGCLAQRDAKKLMLPGVRVIVGVRDRARVVELLDRALSEDTLVNAVSSAGDWSFEKLSVSRHEGKTRATMKIQEGCDRYCAYCIIPYVRGPIRSMPLDEVRAEAERLARAGYGEIVVTGIHLYSYGRGTDYTLLDALREISAPAGVRRIRLGSLEPLIATEAFVVALRDMEKICPQFHLSLQSGSASVLARMRRRYGPEEYLAALSRLRAGFPGCAITTDVLTGFPGETEKEALETENFVREANFARIHVFPYSRRAGTVADRLPGQLDEGVKKERTARLIALGNQLERRFVEDLIGSTQEVLFESETAPGVSEGYTRQYARVRAAAAPGRIERVKITGISDLTLEGRIETH